MQNIGVLVVEDDQVLAESLRATLMELNYDVISIASRGEEVLEILAQISPDIILMDINLPGELNGIKTARLINEKYNLPIIYLTAHEDEKTLNRALDTNPYAYILKPFSENQLRAGIELAISKYKVEKQLVESESKFRNLHETMNQGVVYLNSKGEIISANPAAENILGMKFDELSRTTSTDTMWNSIREDGSPFPGEEHPSIVALRTGKAVKDVLMGIMNQSDKTLRWIRIDARPLFVEGGNIPYQVYSLFEDITMEVKLNEERNKLYTAVEQSSASIVITDETGNIEFVNPACIASTGYTEEELSGKNPRILKSGITDEEEYKKLWEIIRSGKDWRGEFHNKKKNGELYWESAVISPITNKAGKITHYLAVKDDITEQKKQERQLLIAKENAEKSDRLKTEFLAQMSHEIRTPINNIITFISLLKEEFEDKLSGELQASFSILDSSSKRLIRTIELILNMSRIQTGNFETKMEKINLVDDILDDLLMEFYSRAREKGLEISFENNASKDVIKGDRYSIGQIFMNLVGNAVKYTESGYIKLKSYNENKSLVIEIEDSGKGISEEYLPKLFNPFTQEESGYTRSFEGTGLGLSLVKKYVEINNATIDVKSKLGEGTRFTVRFKV